MYVNGLKHLERNVNVCNILKFNDDLFLLSSACSIYNIGQTCANLVSILCLILCQYCANLGSMGSLETCWNILKHLQVFKNIQKSLTNIQTNRLLEATAKNIWKPLNLSKPLRTSQNLSQPLETSCNIFKHLSFKHLGSQPVLEPVALQYRKQHC